MIYHPEKKPMTALKAFMLSVEAVAGAIMLLFSFGTIWLLTALAYAVAGTSQ